MSCGIKSLTCNRLAVINADSALKKGETQESLSTISIKNKKDG